MDRDRVVGFHYSTPYLLEHIKEGDVTLHGFARDILHFDCAATDGRGASEQYEAILFTASGCGAQLADYGRLFGSEGDNFANRVCDIDTFLAKAEWPALMIPAPLNATVAVHDPCTLHNALRQSDAPYRLLERIPQLKVVPLEGNRACCGAAGVYHLGHAYTAEALREPKVKAATASGASYLASANFGCALHIAAGLREHGETIEVLHPVVLLDRQLTLAGW